MQSLTEENYLKSIYKLMERQMGEAVTTNSIAHKMLTKAASVTDMLKRLAEKKLINYRKYQGVTLTAQGKKIAIDVIRKHRLWEVFLVEKLRFGWDQVHDIAEQLEHVQSDELIEKLDDFLGYPKSDPHGDPIPDANGKFSLPKSNSLVLVRAGQKANITGVADHSAAFLRHLDKLGIALGDEVLITEKIEYDQSLHITLNRKHRFFLSQEVARNILVSIPSTVK